VAVLHRSKLQVNKVTHREFLLIRFGWKGALPISKNHTGEQMKGISPLTWLPGFRHQGTSPKKPGGFLGTPTLKNHPKNPHFYFNLILVYTLYATNNAIFYCFKAFKALSY